MLLDEAPSRDIHDGPTSFNLINQLLTLATNSIALCRGAHLGSLKLYQKKFLKLCFMKYESASNLRGPTSLEVQAADKRAWELIGELVNIHVWKLDDARSLGRTALALKLFETLLFDVLLLYWLGARRRGLGPEAGP